MYRSPFFSDCLALMSSLATIAAWQEQLDYWLRIAASAIAIVAGIVALVHRWRQRNRNRRVQTLD